MRRRWAWAGAAGLFAILAAVWATGVPIEPFENIRSEYRSSDILILDRDGELLHEVRVDPEGRRLDWTPLEAISPALREACVFAEDRDFWSHGGVDWSALAAAAWSAVSSGRTRGASTISMQTASLIEPDLQPQRVRRSIWQKIRQIRAAWTLESSWSKEQTLEAYLNLVSFRGELQGVAAASRGLFGKAPHGLNDLESAVLAAQIRSPNASPEAVARRASQLAEGLGWRLDEETLFTFAKSLSARTYRVEQRADWAPHVARRLLASSGDGKTPRRLQTTLSAPLQRFAIDSLRRRLLQVRSKNVRDGAVLVADNATGEVLAYVGSGGDVSSARHVDGVQAFRQAGSTLKPFLYGRAFDREILTPASLLEDNPLNLAVLGGIYRPSNYDNQFRGPVTARVALASSMNIPAVRTLDLVGVEDFVGVLEGLGFRELREPDHYGPSLALGAADVSLWDLANAFRALANQGIWTPMTLVPDPGPAAPRKVFSPQAAYLVANILSDRESRSATFGLDSPLSTRFWTAVKTGTSKDMRDNWCVGWSDRYTVGVWVGNFSGEPMWNVSGVTGAAPVWLEIMDWLHRDRPGLPPPAPFGVADRDVVFAGLGRRHEWFVAGTEPEEVRPAEHPAAYKIAYPPSGAVIALDPDIPSDRQKVFFEAVPASKSLRWVLNGEALGGADSLLAWSPKPGSNLLRLEDPAGRKIDEVAFEVRGGAAQRNRFPPRE